MTLSLRGCSHPPNPGRAKTRLFPGGDGETHCSKVRSNDRSPGSDSSARLRSDASDNTIGLACAFREQGTTTAFDHPFWCARWASKGSCLAYPFTILRSQAAAGRAVSPLAEAVVTRPAAYPSASTRTDQVGPAILSSRHQIGCRDLHDIAGVIHQKHNFLPQL